MLSIVTVLAFNLERAIACITFCMRDAQAQPGPATSKPLCLQAA